MALAMCTRSPRTPTYDSPPSSPQYARTINESGGVLPDYDCGDCGGKLIVPLLFTVMRTKRSRDDWKQATCEKGIKGLKLPRCLSYRNVVGCSS